MHFHTSDQAYEDDGIKLMNLVHRNYQMNLRSEQLDNNVFRLSRWSKSTEVKSWDSIYFDHYSPIPYLHSTPVLPTFLKIHDEWDTKRSNRKGCGGEIHLEGVSLSINTGIINPLFRAPRSVVNWVNSGEVHHCMVYKIQSWSDQNRLVE